MSHLSYSQPSLHLSQDWQSDVRPCGMYCDESFECPSTALRDEGWDL